MPNAHALALGAPIGRAMEFVEPLLNERVVVRELDAHTARRAAETRAQRYHRSKRPISLADAVLLASASPGDRIASADPDVLAVAAAEGVAVMALPDERG